MEIKLRPPIADVKVLVVVVYSHPSPSLCRTVNFFPFMVTFSRVQRQPICIIKFKPRLFIVSLCYHYSVIDDKKDI